MLTYPIGTSGEILTISRSVLTRFRANRQKYLWQSEAGGQLFARILGRQIHIGSATGPRHSDKRGRFFHQSDRVVDQKEIDERFLRGFHYIGDWHTHPEVRPSPSFRDFRTMSSRVLRSKHPFYGFVFILVGRAPPPWGLNVIAHDGHRAYSLEAVGLPG